ncbi:MAG: penicillin-binding protein activator [Pseudomonadota bacterium]
MKFRPCLSCRAIPIIALGIALFFLGCQPKAVVKERPPEVVEQPEPDPDKVLFARAEADFLAGNHDRAVEEYASYLDRFPKGKTAGEALYRMADIYYQSYRYDEALALFQRLTREFPDHPQLPVIQYNMAHILYRLGDFQSSRSEALRWVESYPQNPMRGEMLLLLGNDSLALKDKPQALQWWLGAAAEFGDTPDRKEEIERRIVGLIESATLEDLTEMSRPAEGTPFIPPIYHKMASLYLESNRMEEAKEAAAALVRSTPEQRWVDMGREILTRIREELSVQKGVIGCLLPLTGPFAIYGQEVLNGIQLGMGLFKDSAGEQSMELVIEDTRGEAETAILGLEKLVKEGKVMAVIGPLASKPAVASARKAQELGVPIITLTQKDGITAEGDMVFRNFLIPAMEVEWLLDTAIGRMGLKRFAILYPDNRYGMFFMNLFWDKVEELGGSIHAVESYKTEETDFAEEIKKMVGLYYPRPESLVQMLKAMKYPSYEAAGAALYDPKEKEGEPEPIVDFDAVFLPDNYQQAALIVPQFPFNNVFHIRFLGTSLWQSPELIKMAGDYVQGALFPSGFFAESAEDLTREFVELYKANFDSAPGLLAATGYDTIRLLMDLINRAPIKRRRDLRDALLEAGDFHGLTGKLSFDHQREAVKDPLLLTVRGRRLAVLPLTKRPSGEVVGPAGDPRSLLPEYPAPQPFSFEQSLQ